MKLKGISIVERHAEKAVVGVFGAAALAVVALQFGRPTVVKVDNQSLAPDRAFARITQKAKELDGKLSETNPPAAVRELQVVDVTQSLVDRLHRGVAPNPRLPVAVGMPMQREGIEGSGGPRELPRVAALVPPAPGDVAAAAFGGTIDPLVVARTPGLEKLVPEQQPYDKQAISVRATFPSAEMVRLLETDPDGDGPMVPPPGFWWKSRVEALDVVLERREVNPDGTTSEPVAIPPMPGQPSFRDDLAAGGQNLAEIVRVARERRRDVVQPAYYAMIAGEPWRRPERAAGDGGTAPAVPAAAEIKKIQAEIEGIEKEIERLTVDRDKQPERKQPTKSGGPSGGGGGGIGGGGGMVRGNSSSGGAALAAAGAAPSSGAMHAFGGPLAQQDKGSAPAGPGAKAPADPKAAEKSADERREEQRKANIDRRIKALEEDRTKKEARLRELGVAAAPAPGAPAGGAPAPAAPTTEVKPIESLEDLVVWAHDVTAAPGHVYQYRLRVAVTNPLFGNARQLHADSQSGATSPVIVSQPSPWSEPIGVSGDTRVYFTSAFSQPDATGALGGPDAAGASVELWKFYYGYWRRAKATLKPGDALAAAIATPAAFQKVWEIAPGAKPADAALAGEKPAPDKVPVDVGGFLLDVAAVALESGGGQNKGGWQVLYRDAEGRVVMRSPDHDAASMDRKVLEASDLAAADATLAMPGTRSAGAVGAADGAAAAGAAPAAPGAPATPAGAAAPSPTPPPGGSRLKGG